jgi:hypothetical protein
MLLHRQNNTNQSVVTFFTYAKKEYQSNTFFHMQKNNTNQPLLTFLHTQRNNTNKSQLTIKPPQNLLLTFWYENSHLLVWKRIQTNRT